MERYERYKDSGIEWIGEIPEHWSCSEISFYTCSRNGATPKRDHLEYWNGDIPWMASGEVSQGVVLDTKESITILGLNNSSTELMPIGTVMIALNGQGKTKGTPAILGIASAFNQSLAAFVCDETHLHNRWLYYSFVAMYDYLRGEGTQAQRDGISTASLKKDRICLPTYTIQLVFSDYLDRKVSEIENLIRKTEKSIELLQEYRKSVISEAVTKGLDPNVPMKDSGIEWIGKIPEEWNCFKLLYALEMPITDGPHETPVFYEQGIPFISADAIKNGKVDFSRMRGYISYEYHLSCSRKYSPKPGDIYMIKSGATTGQLGYVDFDGVFDIWSPLAAIRVNNGYSSKFLFYALSSDYFQKQVEEAWSFGTQQNLSMRKLEQLKVVFPKISVQHEIANYLDSKIIKIDSLIEKKKQLVEKLQEYRKSLISECVTGKVKVPGVE